MWLLKKRQTTKRRGAVTVEFALIAPVFMTLVMGVTEVSRLFEVQNQLANAAREGARMAAMERTGGVNTNSKAIQDVKNFLKATGLDPEKVSVQIVDHNNPAKAFNLDDPANSLKYFEMKITVPYSATTPSLPVGPGDFNMNAKIVMRNIKL